MTRRIDVLSVARRDICDAATSISNDNFDVADRFLAAVDETCGFLAANPGMGSMLTAKNPKLGHLRVWRVHGFPSHLIYYRDLVDRIEVVRFGHGSRNWQAILDLKQGAP